MSQRPQRFSGVVMTLTPFAALASAAMRSTRFAVTTTLGVVSGCGKTWSRGATPRLTCR
jgi:hypothetical protein